MKSFVDVYSALTDRIDVILDKNLTKEERQIENEITSLLIEDCQQAINAGDLILRTEKLAAQNRCLTESVILKLIGLEK